MANPNEIELKVVVNGQPIDLDANLNEPLHTLIPKALQQSGNQGQPPENWELRDASGQPLDPNKKIADYGFKAGTTLFLNLKAGVGG